MEIKNRIKLIRKDLKLSQAEFGKKVQISSSQIGCYETGYREIPERVVNDICREFNVNKEWLLNGTGDMYLISKEDDNLMKAVAEISLSDNKKLKNIVSKLIELDEQYIDAISTIIDGLIKK